MSEILRAHWTQHQEHCLLGLELAEKALGKLALENQLSFELHSQLQFDLTPETKPLPVYDRYSPLGDSRSIAHKDEW